MSFYNNVAFDALSMGYLEKEHNDNMGNVSKITVKQLHTHKLIDELFKPILIVMSKVYCYIL